MTEISIGNKVYIEPPAPAVGEVTGFTTSGIPVVRWPSGLEQPVCEPSKLRILPDQLPASNTD